MPPNNGSDNNQLGAFFLHLHPRTIPAETLRPTLSFGLGGMSLLLLLVLLVTGILQLLSYRPEIGNAYFSVKQMYGLTGAAGYLRNVHYWSGNLLIITSFLHLLRVYLTGASGNGRKLNWMIGILMFILLLLANFTGYLLPWDQRAYWAVTIFTAMAAYVPLIGEQLMVLLRGGPEVGQQTLTTFHAIHVGVLPASLMLLAILHAWLVRKAGGLIRSEDSTPKASGRIAAIPHLISREAAFGLGLLTVLLLFAAWFDAPLGVEAHPGESPNPAKAAWYFMGLQELLLHLHPFIGICVIPLLSIGGLLAIPLITEAQLSPGQWFGGRDGRILAGSSLLVGTLATAVAVLVDTAAASAADGPAASWFNRGLLPMAVALVVLAGWFQLCRRMGNAKPAAAVMGVLLFSVGSITALTVIGVWFRGPEMALVWHP